MRQGSLTVDEEAELLARLRDLRFHPIVMNGQAARRTARHYGLGYDYESSTPQPGEPVPEWLLPVRQRAADLAGEETEELVEALVQCYPAGATIGWHRDAPAFGTVVGVSLGATCRLRFQRGTGDCRRVWEIPSNPGRATCWRARRDGPGSTPSRRPNNCATRSPSGPSGSVQRVLRSPDHQVGARPESGRAATTASVSLDRSTSRTRPSPSFVRPRSPARGEQEPVSHLVRIERDALPLPDAYAQAVREGAQGRAGRRPRAASHARRPAARTRHNSRSDSRRAQASRGACCLLAGCAVPAIRALRPRCDAGTTARCG